MRQVRITSRKNPLLQQVRRLLTSRRERQETGLFVADGIKLLEEAVKYCPGLETVILSDGVEAPLPPQVQLIRVPQDVMASVSPMESPQGALMVCRMPQDTAFVMQRGMLLLDGIQDPGNLGAILRTADALDTPVALLEGCADPYSWKTVRASMGAVFRTPVLQTDWTVALSSCHAQGIPIAATALTRRAQDLRRVPIHTMATVIGSEGHGIRPEILERADAEVIIPMNPRCESLNAAAAAAIVIWQLRQHAEH